MLVIALLLLTSCTVIEIAGDGTVTIEEDFRWASPEADIEATVEE